MLEYPSALRPHVVIRRRREEGDEQSSLSWQRVNEEGRGVVVVQRTVVDALQRPAEEVIDAAAAKEERFRDRANFVDQ